MITLPAPLRIREFVVDSLKKYWRTNSLPLLNLPIVERTPTVFSAPPRLLFVKLPEWGEDLAPHGRIPIPEESSSTVGDPKWENVDWFLCIFWYLNAIPERLWEDAHGPAHSYSLRLRGWNPALWSHAWANRIGLFLRRWAARIQETSEEQLFGPREPARIVLSHDVDAVRKTVPIRCKQSALLIFLAIRALSRGRLRSGWKRLQRGMQFFLTRGDYDRVNEALHLSRSLQICPIFNFAASGTPTCRTECSWIFDPAYDLSSNDLREQLLYVQNGGGVVGLHPSFKSWNNSEQIAREKTALERALGAPVSHCRQHWLRFSWEATWSSQERAGLRYDYTLGFNDRPGFRNGGAVSFHPWSFHDHKPHQIVATPLILMDSQLYDYLELTQEQRLAKIHSLLDEVRFVSGEASVLWHPHTLSTDYGWAEGFRGMLRELAANESRTAGNTD